MSPLVLHVHAPVEAVHAPLAAARASSAAALGYFYGYWFSHGLA